MTVTRDQAICIFFQQDFTPENVAIYKRRIRNGGEVDICYIRGNEETPLILHENEIFGRPLRFIRYLPSYEQFDGEQFTIRFINHVYSPENLADDTRYDQKDIHISEIFDHVKLYSTFFDRNMTLVDFITWCSRNELRFFRANNFFDSGRRYRRLFVLDEIYIDNFIIDMKDEVA